LSADDDIDDSHLLGKTLSDLQDGISVDNDGRITGTLHYVEGYTGFSSDPERQSGYFLALHLDSGNLGAFVSVDLVGKTGQEDVVLFDSEAINDEQGGAVLDDNGEPIECTRLGDIIAIFRITDKGSQAIEAVASDYVTETAMTYSLDGLVLEDRP